MGNTSDQYGGVSPETVKWADSKRLGHILDKRACTFLHEAYGGDLDAVADHVKMKVVCPRSPSVGGYYTMTGVRYAVEFGVALVSPDWTLRHTGTGARTALRIGAALIATGRATLHDCFGDDEQHLHYALKDREFFNDLLRQVGYHREFLRGRKSAKPDGQARRLRSLKDRKAKLETQIATVSQQIAALEGGQ